MKAYCVSLVTGSNLNPQFSSATVLLVGQRIVLWWSFQEGVFLLEEDLEKLLDCFTAGCNFLWIDRKWLEKHFLIY